MPKEYDELGFDDDFLFCKILSNNLELTKELLEMILGIRIVDLKLAVPQKTIKITSDGKGIRLDVYVEEYAEDGRLVNTVYDIEMQTRIKKDLPKRVRYYQGMIDLNLIEKGADYEELKKSVIIFICLDDPFGKGLHFYSFENLCIQDTEIPLGDDTRKVFLNPKGTADDVSAELKDFLSFLLTGKAVSDFTKRLDKEVRDAKMKKRWRAEYMTLYQRDRENFNDGKAEGLLEGRLEGRQEGQTQLADAIQKIHAGANVEDLIKAGVPEDTANLAWTCR